MAHEYTYDKNLKTISGPDLMEIVEEELANYRDVMKKAIENHTAGLAIDKTQKEHIVTVLVGNNEATYLNKLGEIKSRVSQI